MLHRMRVRRHDVDLERACAQRGGPLQADETRADHHGAPRAAGAIDDRAAVGQRAQRVNLRRSRAWKRQPVRLGAGGQQQSIERQRATARERNRPRFQVDACHLGAQLQLDAVIRVKVRRAQRHPVFRCLARQIILR